MMEHSDRTPRSTSRREFIALGIGAFVVGAVPVVASRGHGLHRPGLVRRTIPVMGTIADIAVVHPDVRYAHNAIDAAVAELVRVDHTMSRFKPVSDIGRANLEAATGPVAITGATAFVVREALRWADASNGAFDPALGEAVQLWHVDSRNRPPSARQVHRFAGRALYRAVEVDRHRDRDVVLFHDRDVALDLGGIAKGYAVDRAVDALRARGITSALVNAGGDLYAMGSSEDGDPWEVGVRSPDHPDRLATTLRVTDRAIATSGDYEQYFMYDGRRYHHLLDPVTGEPRRTPGRSVTVAADRCIDADAAGTAVFGSPDDAVRGILARAAPHADVVYSV